VRSSEAIDQVLHGVSSPLVNSLIGLFTLFQNDQRLARVTPGNMVLAKASSNSVLERYIVLSYSRDGKFEEYYDVAPELSVDGSLSLIRIHKSSIIECKAYFFQDEDSKLSSSCQSMSKAALFCMHVVPDLTSQILMQAVSEPEVNFQIMYMKAIATGLLSGFISQYKYGSTIEPSRENDAFYRLICGHWSMFVNALACYGLSSMAPLNRRPPAKIEKSSLGLLQMLMNGPSRPSKGEVIPKLASIDSKSSLQAVLTMLSDYNITFRKAVPLTPFALHTAILPQFVKTLSSKINSDVSLPNDTSDAATLATKVSSVQGKPVAKQNRYFCNLGHMTVKVSGIPKGKSEGDRIFCLCCGIPDLETDPTKYFRCSVCDSNFCSVCSAGLNGDVICGNLE